MAEKISRRDFLRKGAGAILGTVAITACGDLLAMEKPAKEEINVITAGEDNFLIGRDELAIEKAVHFIHKGKKAILLYNEGEIKAFENICTHKGGPLKLESDKLLCQWHGALFDSKTGMAVTGPAPSGSKLTPINLREQDGKIYIQP